MALLAYRVKSSNHRCVLYLIQVLTYPEPMVKSVLPGDRSNIRFKRDSGQSLGRMTTRKIGISIIYVFPAVTEISPVCLEKREG